MSFPSSYNIQSPAELISIQPNVPSELRFFQRDTQQLQTIVANINGIERDDYVIVLPGNVPTVNMVLSVADVFTNPSQTIISTIWSNIANVAPQPPPTLANVDVTGFYLQNNVIVEQDGTPASVFPWTVIPGLVSPLMSIGGGSNERFVANQTLRVSGTFNLTFDNTVNSGSRIVELFLNGSLTPFTVVSQQPNANRDIPTQVVVPFVRPMTAGDYFTMTVSMSENPLGDSILLAGEPLTYVGMTLTYA